MENSGVEKPELPASSKRPAPYIHYSFSTHNTDEADVSLYYTLLALLHTTLFITQSTRRHSRQTALLMYSTHYSCTQYTTHVLNTPLPIQQTKRAANSLNPES